MNLEARKSRAQYLNGVATTMLSIGKSVVLAGAPVWVWLGAAGASIAFHCAAQWQFRSDGDGNSKPGASRSEEPPR